MEQHIPSHYDKQKATIKKDASMAFCYEKEQLYLEIDALGVGAGTSLLQVRGGMQFPRTEATNNAAFQLIAICDKKADQHRSPELKEKP